MASGWLKIWRALQDHELWTGERFTRGQAWIDLLMLASYEPSSIRIKGIMIRLQRGDLAWSRRSLSKRWGWNRRTVDKYIEELSKRKMIHHKTSRLTSIISIINFDKYQDSAPQSAPQSAPRSAPRSAPVYIKEVKEVKEVKEIKENTHTTNVCDAEAEDRFKDFWTLYPARYGQKAGKDTTRALFDKLPASDQKDLAVAARNYAGSANVVRSIGIMDPATFIRKVDRDGRIISEPWRSWIHPDEPLPLGADDRWKQDRDEAEEEIKVFNLQVATGEIKVRPRDRIPSLETVETYEAKKAAGKLPMIRVEENDHD